jgi:hypothetical protein
MPGFGSSCPGVSASIEIAETVLSNEVLKLVSAIKSVKALVTRGHTWVSPENGPDPEPDLGGTYRPLG